MGELNDKLVKFSYMGYSETELHNMIKFYKENAYEKLTARIGELEYSLTEAEAEIKKQGHTISNYQKMQNYWFQRLGYSKANELVYPTLKDERATPPPRFIEYEAEIKTLREALAIIAENYTEDCPSSFVLIAKRALSPKPRSEYLKAEINKAVREFAEKVRPDYVSPYLTGEGIGPTSYGYDKKVKEINTQIDKLLKEYHDGETHKRVSPE